MLRTLLFGMHLLAMALLSVVLAEDAALRLVALEKYPIDRLTSADLVPYQRQWLEEGRVSLKGFLLPNVLTQMVNEVKDLPSFRRLQVVRSYGIASPLDAPSEGEEHHPTEALWAQDVFAVAGDQIANSTLIRQLYESDLMANFVAQILGLERLYRYDDRYQDLNVMFTRDGGQRAYHYDASDFIVSVMLQQPDVGGEFEFAPMLRGPNGEENYEKVAQLFRGELPTVVSKAMPGTVTIFNGRRSMHRVRASYGAQTRILAILSYDTQASVNQTRPDLEKNVRLYGERVKLCANKDV